MQLMRQKKSSKMARPEIRCPACDSSNVKVIRQQFQFAKHRLDSGAVEQVLEATTYECVCQAPGCAKQFSRTMNEPVE
jgi:hypothetical protein